MSYAVRAWVMSRHAPAGTAVAASSDPLHDAMSGALTDLAARMYDDHPDWVERVAALKARPDRQGQEAISQATLDARIVANTRPCVVCETVFYDDHHGSECCGRGCGNVLGNRRHQQKLRAERKKRRAA